MDLNSEKFPAWFRWIWVALACWALYWQGMGFLNSLKPKLPDIGDFFQDWASARNYFEGFPLYTDQLITIEHYLKVKIESQQQLNNINFINAHPPTSILLTMPFVFFDYENAQLVWNLISLGLFIITLWRIFRELNIKITIWMLPPFIVFLLICNPLRQHLNQGQLTLVILFLLVEAWIADRSGHNWVAGSLIGVAASIKLFPGFMLLYFILRRKWQSLLAGILCCLLLAGLTAGILGPGVYKTYIKDVLPEIDRFRSHWLNASITGFWSKLFDADPSERLVPIIQSPIIEKITSGLSYFVVFNCLFWVKKGHKIKEDYDNLYSLFMVAMLLVAPITWDNNFLLLLLPFIIIWIRIKEIKNLNFLFLIIFGVLCLEEPIIWRLFYPEGWGNIARPLQSLTVLAYQFYALVGFFVIGLMTCKFKKS